MHIFLEIKIARLNSMLLTKNEVFLKHSEIKKPPIPHTVKGIKLKDS